MMKYNLLLIFFGLLTLTLSAQTITPTQTDEIIIDNGTSGKADPNDRIRYRVSIQNTGGATGNGVQLNVVPDPRTTFVPGTFRSSPLAVPDAYACTGNVGLNVNAANGLKSNDFDDIIAGATITAGTFATTQGGSISISSDCSFTYTPPAGFIGSDTYNYTLNDSNGVGGGVPATDLGAITFTISNLIWFVDNTGGGTGGTGTLASPFKTLADFNSLSPTAGDVVYLEHTGTNYTGGILLENSERLYGEGHTGGANLSNVLPFALAPYSATLPNINGSRPIITNSGGLGIRLASNNQVNGVNVGNCTTFAIDDNGNVGNLSFNNVDINTTGPGLRIDNGGSVFGAIINLTSTGGANGILLDGIGGGFDISGTITLSGHTADAIRINNFLAGSNLSLGTVNVTATGANQALEMANNGGIINIGSGTLTGSSAEEVIINQGSGTITLQAVVNNTSGTMLAVTNRTGGSVDLSGNLSHNAAAVGILVSGNTAGSVIFSGNSKVLTSSSSTAVNLSSNTGATINFTNGGLAITTTSGTGFNAIGGGTVNVGIGATNNSITTTAAKAVNLDGVLTNITFATITAGNVPTEGINLNNLSAVSSFAVPGTVTLGMAAGSNANVNISSCSNCSIDIGTNGTTHNAVNLNSRRASGIVLNSASGTIRFGNVTASNPNSVTVPAIRSTTCAGSIFFAKTDVDMNLAGGNELFTNAETPQDNNGDGDAIYINNFTGTAFTINGGTIENAGDDGIDIRSSQNLNLSNVTTEDVGKSAGATCLDCNSSGVQGFNLTGTNTVTNCSFQRGRLRNFYLSNSTGTATLNITGSTFNDTRISGTPATDNLQVYGTSNASMALDIENSFFTRSSTKQIDVVIKGNAQLTKCDITGTTMDYVDGNSAGIFIEGLDNAQVNFNIMNNPKLHSQNENVVTISSTGTANVQGRIKGNSNMKYNGTSPGGSIFSGIRVLSDGTTSVATVLIENNSLEIVNCDFGFNLSVAGANSAVINATVNANVITATGVTHFEGILAVVNNTAAVGKLLCLTINNNQVSGAALARVCRVRALSASGVRITNYVTDLNTTWINNGNTGSPVVEQATGGGTISAAIVPCGIPTNPLP